MLDSPTNNFCTWNPLFVETWDSMSGTTSMKEGNLYAIKFAQGIFMGTQAIKSHKVYFEMWVEDQNANVGIMGASPTFGVNYAYNDATSYGVYPYGTNKITAGAWAAGPLGNSTDDVYMFAVDPVNNKMWVGRNNSWTGDPAAGTGNTFTLASNSDGYVPWFHSAATTQDNNAILNCGQDSSFAGTLIAQGNQDDNEIGDFYYDVPAGFLALCTSNLPDPAVIPSEHFNTVTYNTSGSGSVTGVGFQPDFLWIKRRDATENHFINDSVRGGNKSLGSNLTTAEVTNSNFISSYDSDGFSHGTDSIFTNGSCVAWNWKAGGTGASNTSGSITSTVSANADAGFSIVSYTGTGSNATIGHGLSSAPEMIIVKQRSSSGNHWAVWSEAFPATQWLRLNTEAALDTESTIWNNTAPTSTVFSAGTNGTNGASGSTYISYCFHSVDGYSKVGSYTGNGSSDGTFVYTGFRVAYVLTKRADASDHWQIFDNKINIDNAAGQFFRPHSSAGEDGVNDIDLLSNGFKLRNTNAAMNASGGTYIYLAFAEVDFKHTNAR
jgi:hypothetical protein